MKRSLFLFALPLAACTTVGPDYKPPAPAQLEVPAAYHGDAANSQSPEALARWWERFGDPTLTGLIEKAIDDNLDLAVSAARLRQAREALVQTRAGRVPTIGASGGVRQSLDSNGGTDTNLSIGADAAWEADLFGGVTRSIEAARADEQGAAYDLGAVRVATVAEVATNYIEARLAQQRLQIARDTLAIAQDNLEIAGWRVQAGLVSSLDSEQARAARAQTAATIPSLESAFASATYRLSVLTGDAPGALTDALAQPEPIPTPPQDIAAGIPADTLRQRPDVRAAERSLAAATARIGVAEAALRPELRLTGNIGASALSLGGLIDAITGNIFAGLSQTLFDGGRLRSQVRSQEAVTEAVLATYRQTVLVGLEDVENGLVALRAARERQQQFAIALDAATNTAILSRSQYRAGLSDFQILLEAERSLLSAREGLLGSVADQALGTVQLYRALGGGWDPFDPQAGTAT